MYNNYRDELEIRKISPYSKEYNNINPNNDIKHEYISPLKRSYDFSVKQNKSHYMVYFIPNFNFNLNII